MRSLHPGMSQKALTFKTFVLKPWPEEKKMKVFEVQMIKPEIRQEAENFPIGGNQSLLDLKGSVILLVFWKTL